MEQQGNIKTDKQSEPIGEVSLLKNRKGLYDHSSHKRAIEFELALIKTDVMIFTH